MHYEPGTAEQLGGKASDMHYEPGTAEQLGGKASDMHYEPGTEPPRSTAFIALIPSRTASASVPPNQPRIVQTNNYHLHYKINSMCS